VHTLGGAVGRTRLARGLVVRKPSAIDRREVVIELTAQGQGLVNVVLDKRRREVDEVVRRMTIEDRDRVVSALELFSQAAGDAIPAAYEHAAARVHAIAPPIPEETGRRAR
jgi:hypothetical protein